MSFAALAEQGRQMAQQYGYRPRPAKPVRKSRVAGARKAKKATTMPPHYVARCAVIVAEIERLGKCQRADIKVSCSHYEFMTACRWLKDKIVYDGHSPFGHWRMK